MIQAMIDADMRCAFKKAQEQIYIDHWCRMKAGLQMLGCG